MQHILCIYICYRTVPFIHQPKICNKRELANVAHLLSPRLVVNDEISQEIGTGTFKQNVMEKTFQQKDLERQISSIKASKPSLSLLEQSPAGNGVGKVFDVTLLRHCQGGHVGQDGRAAIVGLYDLPTQGFKVRVSFPDTNCVANTTFAVNHEILSIFAVLFGLSSNKTPGEGERLYPQ